MSCRKLLLGICIFFAFGAYPAAAQEKSAELFEELLEKYKGTEYKSITLGGQGEGAGMILFDANKKLSEDLFCNVSLFSGSGQTQYYAYKRAGENIWFFHKKAIFYDKPFEPENAESFNTYFKYMDNVPYVFNDSSGKYDIQADTNKYQAVTDVRSLTQLIEIIQKNINN